MASTLRIDTPRKLYKFLLRECEKLPKDAEKYYRHTVKQSFKQHVSETDPERIRQIMEKSLEDAKWIVDKYTKQGAGKTSDKS